MAALLTCGVERSALSHLTAAAIWGLRPEPATIDVTVAANVRSRDGIRVHRVAELPPRYVTTREDLRITTTRSTSCGPISG